jgi:signal peptidase I
MSHIVSVAVAIALSGAVQAQTSKYSRGDVVRLQPTPEGTILPNSRIIAVAGDRIKTEKSAILVNDQALPNVSPEMLSQFVAGGWDQVVPDGHYVVMGERQEASGVVRFHGLIPTAKIIGRVSR